MKKKKIVLIIILASLPFLFIIFGIILVAIEEHIEANLYHIWICNYTDEDLEIIINSRYIINIENRTMVFDKVLTSTVFADKKIFNSEELNYNYFNYLVKSNGNIIFDKEMNVFGSFSAKGGVITYIVINKINDYDIIFTLNESEVGNWLELKNGSKKKWMDYFNYDELNQ